MATTGGNLLQRTRCYYFTDIAFPACNKRVPGSGLRGHRRLSTASTRSSANPIKGATSPETCIATNPSDMNVAMAALNATVLVQGPKGKRSIPFGDFHRLPGNHPAARLQPECPDELITAVDLAARSLRQKLLLPQGRATATATPSPSSQ